jgi:hypothetical protein
MLFAFPQYPQFYFDRCRWRKRNSSYTQNLNWLSGFNLPIMIGPDNEETDPDTDPIYPLIQDVSRVQLRTGVINRSGAAVLNFVPKLQYRVNGGTWGDVGATGASVIYGPSIGRDEYVYESTADLDFGLPRPWPLKLVSIDQNDPNVINVTKSPINLRSYYAGVSDTYLAYIYDDAWRSSNTAYYHHYTDNVYWAWGGIVDVNMIDGSFNQLYNDVYMVRTARDGSPNASITFTCVEDLLGVHKVLIRIRSTYQGYPNVLTQTLITRSTDKILSFSVDAQRNTSWDEYYAFVGVDAGMKVWYGQFHINSSTGAITWIDTLIEDNLPATNDPDYAPGIYGTSVFCSYQLYHIAFIAGDASGAYVWHKMRDNSVGWGRSWAKAWTQNIAATNASIKDLALSISADWTPLQVPFIAVSTNVTIGSDHSPIVLLEGVWTDYLTPIDWTVNAPLVLKSFASSGAGTEAKIVKLGVTYKSLYLTYRRQEGSNYVVRMIVRPYYKDGQDIEAELFTTTDSTAGGTDLMMYGMRGQLCWSDDNSNIYVMEVVPSNGKVAQTSLLGTSYRQLLYMSLSGRMMERYYTDDVTISSFTNNTATEFEYSLWFLLDSLTYGDVIEFRYDPAQISNVYATPFVFYGILSTELGDADFALEAALYGEGTVGVFTDILGAASLATESVLSAVSILVIGVTHEFTPFATMSASGIEYGPRDGQMMVALTLGVEPTATVVLSPIVTKYSPFPYALESDYVERFLDATYVTVTADMEDLLLELINAARINIGRPPYKSYWRDNNPQYPAISNNGPDIAQRHSRNMRDYKTYEHESFNFPEGWRLVPDRLTHLEDEGASGLSENILIASEGTEDNIPAWFQAWWNSPGHRANILRDWSGTYYYLDNYGNLVFGYDDGSNCYFVPGLAAGDNIYGFAYLGNAWLATNNFVNYGKADAVYTEMSKILQAPYTVDVAIFEIMQAAYRVTAYTQVNTQNEAFYRALTSQQVNAPYAAWTSAQHSAPVTWEVSRQLRYKYDDSVPVASQFWSRYNIYDKVFVSEQVESVYAVQVSRQSVAPYISLGAVAQQFNARYQGMIRVYKKNEADYQDAAVINKQVAASYQDMVAIRRQFSSPYSEFGRVWRQVSSLYEPYTFISKEHESFYGTGPTVYAQNESSFSIRPTPSRQNEAPYFATVFIGTQNESLFDFMTYNPINRTNTAYFAMLSESPQNATGVVMVTIAGMPVDADNIDLVQDEGNHWSADITLRDVSLYALINRDDPVIIECYGDTYNLIVEQKSINRSSSVAISGVIRAISPGIAYDSPRASGYTRTFDTEINAVTAIEEILSTDVIWEMPASWQIPAFRITANNAIPIQLARTIIEAGGGVLESEKDGTLRARPEFVRPVPEYWDYPYDHLFTDADDNLSQTGEYQYTDGYNKFRIKEGEALLQDNIEYMKSETEPGGTLRCYPSPWRENVALVHTDGPIVLLDEIGIVEREEVETVEFVAGASSVQYPVYDILALEWLSDALTGFGWVQDSSDLTAETTVNQGYGLAKITYKVRSIDYKTDAPDGSTIQYVLEDLS